MSFGLGDFPLGGFPDSIDASVADPLPGLLSDPSLLRKFVFRALPLNAGSPVNVDISSGGYSTQSTDTPASTRFASGLARPYNFAVNLPLPDLTGGASAGIGEVLLGNADGSLDAQAQYDWLGVQADVYIGKPNDPFVNFTRIMKGRSAGLKKRLKDISVLHRDLRFKLQRPLQNNRYGGFGAAVRGDGVTGTITGTISYPAGSMTFECYMRPVVLPSNNAGIAGWFTGSTVGERFIRMGAAGVSALVVRNDANTAFVINSTTTLAAGIRCHFAFVIDTANSLLHYLINGIEQGAGTAITGTFNTLVTAFTTLKNTNAGLYLNADIDDVRIFNVARTINQIKATMGQILNGTEPGLIYYNPMNEGAGTTATPTVGTGVLTLNGGSPASQWVGTLEGDSNLAGTVKPIAVGKKRQIEPKLVDSQRYVFQWHDGSSQAADELRDKCDLYTFGVDVADIYSATPAAGVYNTCLAKSLVRLGNAPIGTITMAVRGDNSGSLGYQSTTAGIHRKICTQFPSDSPVLSDPADIDVASYTALLSLTSAVVGWYFDNDINIDAALDQIMKEGCSGWWASSRIAQSTVGRIDPPENLTPTVSITGNDIKDPDLTSGQYESSPVGVRVGHVVLGYRPYQTTFTADQIAGAVSVANRYDFGQSYRFVRSDDPNATADADTLRVFTAIDDPIAAQAESDRLLALWKVDRVTYPDDLDSGILSYFIGTVFRKTFARYDTVAGKNFVVAGLVEDMGQYGQADSLTVILFG